MWPNPQFPADVVTSSMENFIFYAVACLQGSGLKFIFHCTAHSEIFERPWLRLTVLVVISSTVESKEVLPPKSFGLDYKPLTNRLRVPKLIPVERLLLPLSLMVTNHLKKVFVDNFSRCPLKDIAAFLLCYFVLTYKSIVPHLIKNLLICPEVFLFLLSHHWKK